MALIPGFVEREFDEDFERYYGCERKQALRWWKRSKFDQKLDWLRTFVWLREEVRDVSNRMYYLIRRKAL